MFETLKTFTDGITSFDLKIPIGFKVTFIIIFIVALTVGGYFLHDYFELEYMRSALSWFIFIAILNLTIILVIYLYYNTKSDKYIGPPGPRGKKGKLGKSGKYVSCSYCKNNIYLQKVRQAKKTCTLSVNTTDFKTVDRISAYFDDIIEKGNINYDSFVNSILLGKTLKDTTQESIVTKFRALMTCNSITIALVKIINQYTTRASEENYGTFRSSVGTKVGYTPIGDSVYGGVEDNLELNSFVVDGNKMYPSSYDKIVSFHSYNEKTGDSDIYSIWRAVGQSVTEPGFQDKPQTFQYTALGDICRYGFNPPKLEDLATIREDCLDEIASTDLDLMFIYVGNLNFTDDSNIIDYTKSDTYLIENTIANNIEVFSVWRTPMNTFITNCNSTNDLVNGTVYYNIYNNYNNALNEYGNVSDASKTSISNLLQSIPIPKILIAAILCKYYETELRQEIVYYFNRFQRSIPEFATMNSRTVAKSSLGDLMNKIKDTQKAYDKFNAKLSKQASISLRNKKNKIGSTYDATKEKRLPATLLKVYNSVNTKLLTISVQIENADTFLDIVNLLFENGLEAKVAVDSDGIAQGGILINDIQETVLRICKMMTPPLFLHILLKMNVLVHLQLIKIEKVQLNSLL